MTTTLAPGSIKYRSSEPCLFHHISWSGPLCKIASTWSTAIRPPSQPAVTCVLYIEASSSMLRHSTNLLSFSWGSVRSTASMQTSCIPVRFSSNSSPLVVAVRSLTRTPSMVKRTCTSSLESHERPCLWSKNAPSVPGLISHSTIGTVRSRANGHSCVAVLLAQSVISREIR